MTDATFNPGLDRLGLVPGPAKRLEREAMAQADVVSLEAELVGRALDGDGQAFATLVRPHLGLMFRLAMRACRSEAIAEDAVQESLTIAFKELHRYTPGTSLKAFLTSIAIKRAHTLFRGERRRKTREDASAEPERAASPLELLSAERTALMVREALAAMPEKRREAAMMRLDGNLSYAEIADAIGSTEGSARVLVHLALKELKQKLAEIGVVHTEASPAGSEGDAS
ncbi:MAG: RNA polymerase sigma factor [Myxococcales bacterium]|nr:RNA polymerase sigma factor [Myxococcales bacterium]